jgi:hypothetical protein
MPEVPVADLAVAPVSPLDLAKNANKSAKRAGGFRSVTAKPEWSADQFITEAKKLVVDNYNAHRDREKTPALTIDLVYVLTFTKAGSNWRAALQSPVLGGLLYEVVYTGMRDQAVINVFRKINSATISY